jgi:hypothetical protein
VAAGTLRSLSQPSDDLGDGETDEDRAGHDADRQSPRIPGPVPTHRTVLTHRPRVIPQQDDDRRVSACDAGVHWMRPLGLATPIRLPDVTIWEEEG